MSEQSDETEGPRQAVNGAGPAASRTEVTAAEHGRTGLPGTATHSGTARPDPDGDTEPHDVLAAEEFAFPAPDPHAPVEDSGPDEPHDVLAAEEFAFPAPGADVPEGEGAPTGGGPSRRVVGAGVVALVALIVVAALRRRKR